MALVLGVDTSTQSCKAVLVDSDDGTVVDQRSAAHPDGTEVDPRAWLAAVDDAAGPLLERAEALAVGGQQHGMVALGADGEPVRDALLWNDTRSAEAARQLIAEHGGPEACAEAVGSVLVASFTVTKLRWLRDHEPENAARVEQVLLPHDYVSAHLAEPGTRAFTDRGDASGTGYYSAMEDRWREDLLEAALGHPAAVPEVVAPGAVAGRTPGGQAIGAGTGDNAAAALGMALEPGDVLLSVGTSGVASTVSRAAAVDGTGTVTCFADATGGFLPLIATMNAARILDLQAALLGVDHDGLAELALSAPAGAHGVTISPYYGGERTPNRPDATGTWTGLRPTTTRADLARAAYEALLCSLADAADLLAERVPEPVGRVLLVGGAARSAAVRALAPAVLGRPVVVPPAGEYVALGAARQAAWALAGTEAPPTWPVRGTELLEADPTPDVRARYSELRDRTTDWS
ncbi:xylulokinase [Nocardioides anomalus]|uniref:Xylulose kinase n=1 Tax=Nocardioides anomalus TaxID=2712223 RepID=A0A6G6W9I8_9ACTN|nr:xylulokinase [Nocardioides anomalus]QIG41886.1 xylulokinase [Nocardioides anomalus]